MQTFREKTYTRNNSFMNYQQIYSFNQWNDLEEDTFLSTLPENNLKICYRLQNIAILATERTQLQHPKKIFPRSSPFYRMWRHFSLDDPNTKNVPGVVECSPPLLKQSNNRKLPFNTFALHKTYSENITWPVINARSSWRAKTYWMNWQRAERIVRSKNILMSVSSKNLITLSGQKVSQCQQSIVQPDWP